MNQPIAGFDPANPWNDPVPQEIEPPADISPKQRVAFQTSGPAARKRPGLMGWDLLLGANLGLLALLFAGSALLAGSSQASGEAEAMPGSFLWFEIGFSAIAFTVIPLVWLLGTRQAPLAGTARYLGLYRTGPSMGWGVAWAIGLLIAMGIFGYAYDALGGSTDNPQLEGILASITWPAAVGLALSAGIGEEVLFRGILQKRLGVWGQALLFGLAHASYGVAIQVVLPFLIALFFGYLVRRGYSLWVPITAHVLFDFAVAASGILSR